MRVKQKQRFVKMPAATQVLQISWRPAWKKYWIMIPLIDHRTTPIKPFDANSNFPAAARIISIGRKTVIELLPAMSKGGEMRVAYIPDAVEI